ncbi:MAG: F0F1 ATP synthase subunit gamma [Actinomycetia bacterium]|nr:F0F1 ATP synthase subunit gamma [Actinomycetes bacterium]
MQKLIELKKRMRTVSNIRTVTSTLATVSSAKLSRTRRHAAGMREYAESMRRVLQRQQGYLEELNPRQLAAISPYFAKHEPVRTITLLHITADRGMCGNYNQVANRLGLEFAERRSAGGQQLSVIAKGLKGERYMRRKSTCEIVHAEGWTRAGVAEEDVTHLYELCTGRFLDGQADEVWCLYTRFHSPMKRTPRLVRLLPVAAERIAPASERARPPQRWAYEPSFEEIVDELVAMFVRIQIEDVLLESYASEQGARMVTMEEASERADKSLHEMRMRFNRLRREVITTDLIGVLFASQVRTEEEQRTAEMQTEES